MNTVIPSSVGAVINDPGVCVIDDTLYIVGAEGPDCTHFNHFLIGKIIPTIKE